MFCRSCGSGMPDAAKFCPKCGTKTISLSGVALPGPAGQVFSDATAQTRQPDTGGGTAADGTVAGTECPKCRSRALGSIESFHARRDLEASGSRESSSETNSGLSLGLASGPAGMGGSVGELLAVEPYAPPGTDNLAALVRLVSGASAVFGVGLIALAKSDYGRQFPGEVFDIAVPLGLIGCLGLLAGNLKRTGSGHLMSRWRVAIAYCPPLALTVSGILMMVLSPMPRDFGASALLALLGGVVALVGVNGLVTLFVKDRAWRESVRMWKRQSFCPDCGYLGVLMAPGVRQTGDRTELPGPGVGDERAPVGSVIVLGLMLAILVAVVLGPFLRQWLSASNRPSPSPAVSDGGSASRKPETFSASVQCEMLGRSLPLIFCLGDSSISVTTEGGSASYSRMRYAMSGQLELLEQRIVLPERFVLVATNGSDGGMMNLSVTIKDGNGKVRFHEAVGQGRTIRVQN